MQYRRPVAALAESLPADRARRALIAALTSAVAAPRAVSAPGAQPELRVITRDNSEITRQILLAIDRRVGSFAAALDPQALMARPGRGLYVALGPAALEACIEASMSGPLVALFTSAGAVRRLVAAAPRRLALTAIYAEASPASQLRLIRALYNRRVTVGVLLSDATAADEPLLRSAADDEGLDLEVLRVEPGANVLRSLALLRSAKVLLALPDPGLYTVDNLRGVLESTYRRGQAVIGFSAPQVGAGMLAAAYAGLDDTIADFGELVAGLAAGGLMPAARHPAYWRVAINELVARSLNLVVDVSVRQLGRFPP